MVLSPAQKLRPAVSPTPWTLDEVAGRLVEISGSTASAALTLTFSLVREAQAARRAGGVGDFGGQFFLSAGRGAWRHGFIGAGGGASGQG